MRELLCKTQQIYGQMKLLMARAIDWANQWWCYLHEMLSVSLFLMCCVPFRGAMQSYEEICSPVFHYLVGTPGHSGDTAHSQPLQFFPHFQSEGEFHFCTPRSSAECSRCVVSLQMPAVNSMHFSSGNLMFSPHSCMLSCEVWCF